MASFYFNGSTTTAKTLSIGEAGVVGPAGSVVVQNTDAISGTGSNRLVINGTVVSYDGNGQVYDYSGSTVKVFIGPRGYAASDNSDAFRLSHTGTAAFVNAGTIHAEEDAVVIETRDNGATILFENTGTITGGSDGVRVASGDTTTVLKNSGTITGIEDQGLQVQTSGTGGYEVTNTGKIEAPKDAYRGNDGTGSDLFVNAGIVVGDVNLRGGDDTFDGRGGTVRGGRVEGGQGDDLYIIDDTTISLFEGASEGTDTVRSAANWTLGDNFENLELIGTDNINGAGNELANTMTGNGGDNRLAGLAGDDTVSGGAGDDHIRGGGGDDSLTGGFGQDTLTGGFADDRVIAQNGDDWVAGNQGNDTLQGNQGNDTMVGGLGADRMLGGFGTDTFLFWSAADSAIGAGSDRIVGFASGVDKLDLSRVFDGTMDLNIGGSFSGDAGSVRTTVFGGNTQVYVDLDGVGGADMRIILQNVTNVSEDDFIL